MSKRMIEAFLTRMRERHRDEIEALVLPDGTLEVLAERAAAGDVDTLQFLLKLAYLMGLQTGFAAGQSAAGPDAPPPRPNTIEA